MAAFLTDDFLLENGVARELYHGHAKDQPIYDYHCHLPPGQIAENKVFRNLFEIWLAGDHYKWRAMRANGVPEELCTGGADDKAKFMAFAKTVPMLLRNPLYHWTHLELKNYFGITRLLDANSAEAIWEEANAKLPGMSVHAILESQNVAVVCTTDDPADNLADHRKIREQGKLRTKVFPAFRPDRALWLDDVAGFNAWVDRLADCSGIECKDFGQFLEAIEARHTFFHEFGARISDHGLSHCPAAIATRAEAGAIFDQVRSGKPVTPEQADRYAGFLMVFFGELDAARGWAKQLHLGALRNVNSWALRNMGRDTGFDTIGDWLQAEPLARYMDALATNGRLPKMILYNLNPNMNYVFGAMTGNFQDGSVAGKIQFGSGWWFLDQKEGIEWQLNALSNLGLLGRFVGMLTDSRSFLSFPRHEYFRRILCNLIGKDVERGELPRDMELLGAFVRGICFGNAKEYFGLPGI